MDILKVIGEDGSGNDIGKRMKNGGKADTEDPMTGAVDLLKKGTVITIGIKKITTLMVDNAC
jgi:hypothetical protein